MLKKISKFVLHFLGILVAFIVLIFLIADLVYNIHENATKKLLANELTNLPVPPTCSEKSRQYYQAGGDGVSNWLVNYSCQTIGQKAYDYIISHLSARGYSEKMDFSKGSPNAFNVFYSFTYSSSQFTTDYQFGDINGPTYPIAQKALLESAPVSSIQLQLTRNQE